MCNPIYAGAYVYGRITQRAVAKPPDKLQQRAVRLPPQEWLVTIWDAFPAYISRAEYDANQAILESNRLRAPGGPPRRRDGPALLTGIALCGRCGQPLQVVYSVLPVSSLGCQGDVVQITLTVNPEPVADPGMGTALCSDEPTGITLAVKSGSAAAATWNITNITVDAGLVPGSDNAATGTALPADTIYNDTFTNLTGGDLYVVYDVVPVSAEGCEGETEQISVTIHPEPFMAAGLNDTVCSGAPAGITLAVGGGSVAVNPLGREWGIARNIELTDAGQLSPMLRGKPARFDGFIMHLDEVTRLPDATPLLATNPHTHIQAAVIEDGEAAFWSTQYHPEYNLHEMGRLIAARGAALVKEGIFPDEEAVAVYAAKMMELAANPESPELRDELDIGDDIIDPQIREVELRNWLRFIDSRTVA